MSALSRTWVVLRREAMENLRQRWLLVTLGGQLGLIAAGAFVVLSALDHIAGMPSGDKELEHWSAVLGMPMTLGGLTGLVVGALDYLVLTQLLGMTAVIAGHAALHDRQTGTLPFLLLAPVRRSELLTGKVLGALAVPLLFYLTVGGGTLLLASTLPVAASQAAMLPPAPGFLVAFYIGAPAWSAAVAANCVTIGALAEDVRTAQQAAWVLVFFATFLVGPLLVNLMVAGAAIQLAVAALGLLLAVLAIAIATLVVSRELGR
jgi:ABC-type transport system involved in multi-copper enzyme maturation permease subunit